MFVVVRNVSFSFHLCNLRRYVRASAGLRAALACMHIGWQRAEIQFSGQRQCSQQRQAENEVLKAVKLFYLYRQEKESA